MTTNTPHLVRTSRRAVLALAVFAFAGCAAQRAPAPVSPPPRLVVFIAIDGLPQRQVTAYRDQLAPDGFARFLERGTWFSEAHYGHGFTVTAAGHATMLTGAYPHRTGIIGNDWRVRETGELMYCTGDARYQYIGNTTKQLDGTSPANLQAETVGDMLRKADPRAKVIAISGKDRGAILPAGKTGTAYMYMGQSGQFASSTFYMAAHPAWVDAFNAEKRADRYFKKAWTPLLPDAAYARSLPDGQSWYAKGGKLPAVMGEAQEKPDGAYYAGLLRSPFVDAMSLEVRARSHRGRGPGPRRCARHPVDQPVGARLREPRLQCRVAPVARPPAATGPPARSLFPGAGRQRGPRPLRGGADGRPWLHAGPRAQPEPGPCLGPA